ncbi:MAG: hypothetical protein K0R18_531 [Bacillales bacterium]|jgi:hypothetical protein|nr:hypothetical protein [Bacillales bacterium]
MLKEDKIFLFYLAVFKTSLLNDYNIINIIDVEGDSMNKPGSHRGAPSMKKKRFANGDKKQPVLVVDKLREFCAEVRVEAEKNSTTNKYTRTTFRCKDLAQKFKCRIGEVVKAVEHLNRERLTSTIGKRFLDFDVRYEDARDKEDPRDLELFFKKEHCPICGSELARKDRTRDIREYDQENKRYNIVSTTLMASRVDCKNKCFTYDADRSFHVFSIFGDLISINSESHKSIVNHKLKEVKKEIDRFKKNERYVFEIMVREI